MEDRLEKYIKNHRKEMDILDPPAASWDKIVREMDASSSNRGNRGMRPLMLFISGMAATLVIGLLGFLSYQYINQSTYTDGMVSTTLPKEYLAIEQDYITQVNNKMEELDALKVDKTILDDLSQLDAIYQELKAELLSSGGMNQDQIIEAVIKNYKTKIELLEFIKYKYEKKEVKDELQSTEI